MQSDLAQGDENLNLAEKLKLAAQVRGAARKLQWQGLIVGWRAPSHAADPGALECQSVVAMGGSGLVGKTLLVERAVKPVARAVPGKDASGAVGSMCCGCQADHPELCPWVSEARDRAAPIGLVQVSLALFLSSFLTMLSESRAGITLSDRFFELLKALGHSQSFSTTRSRR